MLALGKDSRDDRDPISFLTELLTITRPRGKLKWNAMQKELSRGASS